MRPRKGRSVDSLAVRAARTRARVRIRVARPLTGLARPLMGRPRPLVVAVAGQDTPQVAEMKLPIAGWVEPVTDLDRSVTGRMELVTGRTRPVTEMEYPLTGLAGKAQTAQQLVLVSFRRQLLTLWRPLRQKGSP